MIGTLIKTMTNQGFCIGIIQKIFIDYGDRNIVLGVTWNDGDVTTEVFEEREGDWEAPVYHFHNNGRWWQIGQNYYKFKRLLEEK